MITVVKTISTRVDKLKRRIVKVLRFGKDDVQESIFIAPFGIDSNPIKDLMAVYAKTGEEGKTVLIGYINKNSIAEPGELRLFSTDANGVEKIYHYLKNDGTMELGGNAGNLTRYQELKSGFDQLKQDVNSLINSYNTHTHVLALSAGTGTAAPTVTQGTPSSADISGSKIDEIKTL